MTRHFPSPIRAVSSAIVGVLVFILGGCEISFEQDPAETVKIEITGITAESDRDEVKETLSGMTDGSSHTMSSFWSGDTMTVNLSPVSDVEAFSRKINFGEVTEVKDRTVKVTFVK